MRRLAQFTGTLYAAVAWLCLSTALVLVALAFMEVALFVTNLLIHHQATYWVFMVFIIALLCDIAYFAYLRVTR